MRVSIFCLVGIGAVTLNRSLGDQLFLEDGRKLSGDVERTNDTVSISTAAGETHSFSPDQVRRVVYESTASPADLIRMLDDFEGLIEPVMGFEELNEPLQEPRQREFPKLSRTDGRNTTIWRGGREREFITSDRFVDDWVRYSAHFVAIERTQLFRLHMSMELDEHSLGEFARYTPEGFEDIGRAIKDALSTVKSMFENAETVNRLLDNHRRSTLTHDEKILRASRRSKRRETKKGRTDAKDDLQRLIDRKAIELRDLQLLADDKTNSVAAERIVAMKQLEEVRRLLGEITH